MSHWTSTIGLDLAVDAEAQHTVFAQIAEADGRAPRVGLHHLGVQPGEPAGDPRSVAGLDREREIEVQVGHPGRYSPESVRISERAPPWSRCSHR